MSSDDRDKLVEHLQRTSRRWRTAALVALAVVGGTLGWTGVLLDRTQRLEQQIEALARLKRDFERLESRVEQLQREVPALREAAERVDEDRIVPVNWEKAPDGTRARGALFPDDQMYRRFDIPSRPRMISPSDPIVRPLETRESRR